MPPIFPRHLLALPAPHLSIVLLQRHGLHRLSAPATFCAFTASRRFRGRARGYLRRHCSRRTACVRHHSAPPTRTLRFVQDGRARAPTSFLHSRTYYHRLGLTPALHTRARTHSAFAFLFNHALPTRSACYLVLLRPSRQPAGRAWLQRCGSSTTSCEKKERSRRTDAMPPHGALAYYAQRLPGKH